MRPIMMLCLPLLLAASLAHAVDDTTEPPADTSGAGTPDAAQRASIERAVTGRYVRVTVNGHGFSLRNPPVAEVGLGAEDAEIEGYAVWVGDEEMRIAPPSLPLAWRIIERIEVQRSGTARAAWVGALIVPTVYVIIRQATHHSSHEDDNDFLVPLGLIPVGAGLGALWGAHHPRWESVWRRP